MIGEAMAKSVEKDIVYWGIGVLGSCKTEVRRLVDKGFHISQG